MSNKKETKGNEETLVKDYTGGGMKGNATAKTYDEFVKAERERLFPEIVKKQNDIKEKLFDAFRNERLVKIYTCDGLSPYTAIGNIGYNNTINIYVGYVNDCYLDDDGTEMIVMSGIMDNKAITPIKISKITSCKILTDEEIKESNLNVDDYDVCFTNPYKCNPHFSDELISYTQDFNKVLIRASVPMDFEVPENREGACLYLTETPIDDEFYESKMNAIKTFGDNSVHDAIGEVYLTLYSDYFTKEEIEDNKGMKILIILANINEVPRIIDELNYDNDEVRHQIISLDDYTGDIEHVHYDALSKENYEYMIKAYTPYNLFESDYNIEESDDREEE